MMKARDSSLHLVIAPLIITKIQQELIGLDEVLGKFRNKYRNTEIIRFYARPRPPNEICSTGADPTIHYVRAAAKNLVGRVRGHVFMIMKLNTKKPDKKHKFEH
jgi:hypothetical protein